MEKLVISSGIKKMPVVTAEGRDTGRTVEFNPADQGFAEDLYGLVSKIMKIHESKSTEYKAEADPAVRFDISRAEDIEMREAVDAMFGDGFCRDVFKTRLFAVSGGLTVIENFLYSLMDEMDESITENMAKRDAQIKKYTAKYSKYKKH